MLHYKSLGESDPHAIILASGTFVGYTVILVGLFAGKILMNCVQRFILWPHRVLYMRENKNQQMTSSLFLMYFCFVSFFFRIVYKIGYILSTPINKRIDIFFSLIGCALFIATGALILQVNETSDNKWFWMKLIRKYFNRIGMVESIQPLKLRRTNWLLQRPGWPLSTEFYSSWMSFSLSATRGHTINALIKHF